MKQLNITYQDSINLDTLLNGGVIPDQGLTYQMNPRFETFGALVPATGVFHPAPAKTGAVIVEAVRDSDGAIVARYLVIIDSPATYAFAQAQQGDPSILGTALVRIVGGNDQTPPVLPAITSAIWAAGVLTVTFSQATDAESLIASLLMSVTVDGQPLAGGTNVDVKTGAITTKTFNIAQTGVIQAIGVTLVATNGAGQPTSRTASTNIAALVILDPPAGSVSSFGRVDATQASVTIAWAPVQDAVSYEYTLNGGTSWAAVPGLDPEFTYTGALGAAYSIGIRALDAGSVPGTAVYFTGNLASAYSSNVTSASIDAVNEGTQALSISWTSSATDGEPHTYRIEILNAGDAVVYTEEVTVTGTSHTDTITLGFTPAPNAVLKLRVTNLDGSGSTTVAPALGGYDDYNANVNIASASLTLGLNGSAEVVFTSLASAVQSKTYRIVLRKYSNNPVTLTGGLAYLDVTRVGPGAFTIPIVSQAALTVGAQYSATVQAIPGTGALFASSASRAAPSASWSAGVLTVTYTHATDWGSRPRSMLEVWIGGVRSQGRNIVALASPQTFNVSKTLSAQSVVVKQIETNADSGSVLVDSNTVNIAAGTYVDVATTGQGFGYENHGANNVGPGNRFDDNAFSTSTSTSNQGMWYGQDFGAGTPKNIRQVSIKQGTTGDGSYAASEIYIQYADTGPANSEAGDWTTAELWDSLQTFWPSEPGTETITLAADHGAHRFWRVYVPGFNSHWRIHELDFKQIQ